MTDGELVDEEAVKANIRARWAALPEQPPRSTAASSPSDAEPAKTAPSASSRAHRAPTRPRQTSPTTSSSLPLVPIVVAGAAAVVVAFLLPVLYGSGFIRALGYVGAGVVLGLALTPLRRWDACTSSTLMGASVAVVLAASALSFVAASLYGLRPPGAVALGIQAAAMFAALRFTLMQTRDDTLDAA